MSSREDSVFFEEALRPKKPFRSCHRRSIFLRAQELGLTLCRFLCLFSQIPFCNASLHGGSACELCTQRPKLYSHRSEYANGQVSPSKRRDFCWPSTLLRRLLAAMSSLDSPCVHRPCVQRQGTLSLSPPHLCSLLIYTPSSGRQRPRRNRCVYRINGA